MATFTLSNDYAIRGDQLVDEIQAATGIDLGEGSRTQLSFVPPNIVQIPDELVGDQADAIQAIIDAHVPDPMYFQDDRDELLAKVNWQELRDRWQNEMNYLEAAIPAVDTMDLTELRGYIKRLGQENLQILKSFALLFRRMS